MSVTLLLVATLARAGDDAPATDTPPANGADTGESSTGDATAPEASDARDDVFGAPPNDANAPTPSGDSREDVFGPAPAPGDQALLGQLAEADDRLAIGGRLWLRTNVAVPEVDDLGAEQVTTSSPNFMDVYLDGRPNDRLRTYASARLYHDWSVLTGDTSQFGATQPTSRVLLDQLWVKFDVSRKVYVTAGRQRVKWGAGRFWNPTDVLNRARLDSLAFFDERTGVSLIKVHVPLEAAGANLYAVADLEGANAAWTPEDTGTTRREGPGGALRAEWAIGPGEFTATVGARPGGPLRIGADTNVGLGWFDLRVEGALRHGGDAHRWAGSFDLGTFTTPTKDDRSEEWIPQVVAALEVPISYGEGDSVNLGVETFWNDEGYEDASLYTWLLTQGEFQPFYLGRHYVAGYVFLAGPGDWNDTNLTTSVLSNLSDETYTARADISTTVLTYLQLNVYGQYSFGENGEFHYALDIPAIPGVLDEPVRVPATRFATGVGARVAF